MQEAVSQGVGWYKDKKRQGCPGHHLPLLPAHLFQMMIMPIVTWGLSILTFSGGVGHVMDMLVGIYQKLGNTFSPTTRRALGSDPAFHARRVTVGNLTHPQTACQVMRNGLQGELEEEENDDDNDEEFGSSSDEISPDASDLK